MAFLSADWLSASLRLELTNRLYSLFCVLKLGAIIEKQEITVDGYHQYAGGCSVQWRDIITTVEGYHQYIGGIPSVLRRIFSTVEGYHQYSEGIS